MKERTMNTGTNHSDLDDQLRVLSESLKEVINKFVVEWTGIPQMESLLHDSRSLQKENTKRLQGKLATLQESVSELKDKETREKKAGEELSEDIRNLRTSLENVKREAESLLQQKEQLHKSNSGLEQQNRRDRTDLDERGKASRNTLQELEHASLYFKDRLGLQLKKVSGGRMQMVFTCIDYKSPEKMFYCFVKIKPDQTYEISGCEPPVNDLDQLIERLNATNNFRAFVKTLRQRFKSLV